MKELSSPRQVKEFNLDIQGLEKIGIADNEEKKISQEI